MASAFPRKPPVEHISEERTDITLESDEGGTVLDAVSSDTAQAIITTLQDEPRPVSDIAEAIDSSLQNVSYHLEKLRDAGLVEPVDTWYSSRGVSMTVYALTADRLVVRFGSDGS